MRRHLIPLVSLLLTSVCSTLPVAAGPLDVDPFKKPADSDDLFNYMKDNARKERREEEEREAREERAGRQDGGGNDGRNVLKKMYITDFTDTDFSKSTFTDFKDDPAAAVFTDATGAARSDTKNDGSMGSSDDDHGGSDDDDNGGSDDDDSTRSASEDAYAGGGDDWSRLSDYRRHRMKDEKRAFKILTKPYEDALHDWVPSSPDPIQNGGFSIADDNGSVVPYKLNGWINLQKGFPWGDGDP